MSFYLFPVLKKLHEEIFTFIFVQFSAMFHLQYPLVQVTSGLTGVFQHRGDAMFHLHTLPRSLLSYFKTTSNPLMASHDKITLVEVTLTVSVAQTDYARATATMSHLPAMAQWLIYTPIYVNTGPQSAWTVKAHCRVYKSPCRETSFQLLESPKSLFSHYQEPRDILAMRKGQVYDWPASVWGLFLPPRPLFLAVF